MLGRRHARLWRRALALFGASLVPLAVGGGCRQLVGVEERTEQCGGLAFAEAACAQCMDGACCAEQTACSGDGACASAADALNACGLGDASCRIQANALAPPGNTKLTELTTCRATTCSTACGSCGGLVDPFGAPCDDCVKKSCCELSLDCARDESCAKAYACIQNCSSAPDCANHCLQGPLRDQAVIAFQSCVQSACFDACKIGQDWECVGNASWGPPPAKDSLNLKLTVVEFLTKKVVPNAKVEPCSPYSLECTPSATTDQNGVASLVLPVNPASSWSGYFRVTAAGFVDLLTSSTKTLSMDDFTTAYVLKQGDLETLLGAVGATLDPNKALVFATALDCNGFNSPGIRFELTETDPGVLISYFPGPGSDPDHTNKFGTAAFGDVPINSPLVGISMYLGEKLVGDTVAPIEAGKMTGVGLYPKF